MYKLKLKISFYFRPNVQSLVKGQYDTCVVYGTEIGKLQHALCIYTLLPTKIRFRETIT